MGGLMGVWLEGWTEGCGVKLKGLREDSEIQFRVTCNSID